MACAGNVKECERERASRELSPIEVPQRSSILAPRSQLKFLYSYLIVKISYTEKSGPIDAVVAIFCLESHGRCFHVVHRPSQAVHVCEASSSQPPRPATASAPSLRPKLVPALARFREPIISGDHTLPPSPAIALHGRVIAQISRPANS